jgi:hypothetical protein
VRQIADILADDHHVRCVLHEPADGRYLDRARLRQRRQEAPMTARLAAVLPANDNERAIAHAAAPSVIRHRNHSRLKPLGYGLAATQSDFRLFARRQHGREVAQVVDPGALLLEIGELSSGQFAFARDLDAERVDEAAVDQHLVVKVRTRG